MEEIKKKANFNINIKILKEFNIIAKEKAINKSQFIENLIKIWIQQNK
jgi:hypothetical protein